MNHRKGNGISRRQFARRAALLSASATLAPAANVFAQPSPAIPAQDSAAPHLSPESQTEADARLRQILAQYGTRFSEDDKKTLQQLNLTTQQSLDRVRAYPLENSDSPALYLKPLVEREKKKPEAASPAKKS